MLKSIWNRVVHNFHEIRQESDRDRFKTVERRRNNAEKGFETRVLLPMAGPHATHTMIYDVQLSPQEAQKIISECDEELEALKKRMEMRRDKYSLKL